MATKHPRLNIVLETPLYRGLQKLADREGVSLSLMARDLIKKAMDLHEDVYWDRVAEDRVKTYSSKTSLTHDDVWSKKA